MPECKNKEHHLRLCCHNNKQEYQSHKQPEGHALGRVKLLETVILYIAHHEECKGIDHNQYGHMLGNLLIPKMEKYQNSGSHQRRRGRYRQPVESLALNGIYLYVESCKPERPAYNIQKCSQPAISAEWPERPCEYQYAWRKAKGYQNFPGIKLPPPNSLFAFYHFHTALST